MDKQLFDEVIGEVPPATFDVAGLVTRGRRAVRVRRVVNPMVAAGLAVLLLSGAVAFSMTNDTNDDGGSTRIGGNPTTSETTEPATPETGAPATCIDPVTVEPSAEVAKRLGQATQVLVAAQRPELQLSPNMTGAGRGALEFGYVSGIHVPGNVCDSWGKFVAAATTAGPEGRGNVVMSIVPAYYVPPLTCPRPQPSNVPYCEMVTGPNGEEIKKTTEVAENGLVTKMVEIVRPDGTALHLTAENVATSGKTGDAATAPQPPLNHDQLVTIGLDPALALFP